ncbi:nitric-oxide reductase, partial [bacterium]
MHPKDWWKYLLVVVVLGAAGMMYMGVKTYDDAPPIPDFKDSTGRVLASRETILDGQAVFQKYALMQYGTMFGDGGARGPDFTAEALRQVALSMKAHYDSELKAGADFKGEGIGPRVQREIKENAYDSATKSVTLNAAQAKAYADIEKFYVAKFTQQGPESFKPAGYITNEAELKQLAAFFFWGAWVCGAERPGGNSSYTHNWPYDELAGNRPTAGTVFWSVMGTFALIFVFGLVLYVHGRMGQAASWQPNTCDPVATHERANSQAITATQRATYKFFAVAMLLFFLQIVAGIFTVHD